MSYATIDPDAILGDDAEIGFGSRFSYESASGTPVVAEYSQGIRLTIINTSVTDSILSAEILISYTLDRSLISSFAHIEDAIVVVIDRPNIKKTDWFSLADPHTEYVDYEGLNYDPQRAMNLDGFSTLFCRIEATFKVDENTDREQVYIRALFRDYTSNVAAVRLGEDEIITSHYLEGKPFTPVSIEELESQMLEDSGEN